jgi:hypothetical protein
LSGRQQHLAPWGPALKPSSKLDSVHAGHVKVRHQDIDPSFLASHLLSLLRIVGLQDPESGSQQQIGRKLQQMGIIVHYQNGRLPPSNAARRAILSHFEF